MSYREQEVTLQIGRVVAEKGVKVSDEVEGVTFLPRVPLRWVVESLGREYVVDTMNQGFVEGSAVTLMVEGNNAELLHDALEFDAPKPVFVLDDSRFAEFFGGSTPSELRVPLYTKKFKLFGDGTKRMEKEMMEGRSGTRAEGLVLAREISQESQMLGKFTVPTKILVLVYDVHGMFLTHVAMKISFSKKELSKLEEESLKTAPGEFVDVVFEPANKACAVVQLR